jgi:simple sugar transport system ATP-binding protein
MRQLGLAHVPEDRHRMGLVLPFAAYQSSILGYQRANKYNHGLTLDDPAIRTEYTGRADDFDIRPRDPSLTSNNFSGGNQQKIVLAREIGADPKLLLVGQPTRGVDIGAIEFIHQQIMDMRNEGKGILLVSVELDEIMTLSDRIIVMCDGIITGELSREEANEQNLGLLMANAAGTTAQAGSTA